MCVRQQDGELVVAALPPQLTLSAAPSQCFVHNQQWRAACHLLLLLLICWLVVLANAC